MGIVEVLTMQDVLTKPGTTPVRSALKLFRPDKPAVALGLAVSHLMTKPAFANLKFGEWSRILVGQINRGHYCFVVDDMNQIQGFAGWALATKEKAEAWLAGRRPLSYEDSLTGDCMICNAWSANTTRVHRYMFREARKVMVNGKAKAVYFKRYYDDGSVRPACFNINDMMRRHVQRQAADSTGSDFGR
jgi:hemolysin-activating ACP:hemolysin acyltransferase